MIGPTSGINGTAGPFHGVFGGGSKTVLPGNTLGNHQQHNFRSGMLHKSVIAHNEMRGVSIDGMRHSLELHGLGLNPYNDNYGISTAQVATSKVVVANNLFGSAQDTNDWTIGLCPQNGESAEGIDHKNLRSPRKLNSENSNIEFGRK